MDWGNALSIIRTRLTPIYKALQKAVGSSEGLLNEEKIMGDLSVYIENRKKKDPEFEKNYETGYEEFKTGLLQKKQKEAMPQEDSKSRIDIPTD
jgi:hypothetical protein